MSAIPTMMILTISPGTSDHANAKERAMLKSYARQEVLSGAPSHLMHFGIKRDTLQPHVQPADRRPERYLFNEG